MKNKDSKSIIYKSGAGINLLRFFVPLSFLFVFLHALPALPAQETEPAAYDFRSRQAGYFGPEADEPEPENPEEILIAYFGPGEADHPEYGEFWTALEIAEKHLNEQGGYGGIPIRVKPVWTDDPWAGGISDMVKVFYEKDIWAIIGSVNSASTHLLEQISAKIRIPVLSPVSTDKSANLANVPWLFSMQPGDHVLAEQLAERLERRIREKQESFVLISGMDHDSRLFAREFRMQISEKKLVPEFIFEYDPDIPIPWDRIRKGTATFVVIASPAESASLVRTIRETNTEARILGGPFMGRNSFLRAFRGDCGEIEYISPGAVNPDSDFSRQFKEQTGRNPDYAAAGMYDSLILVHQAMRDSGLNRVRLMQEIRKLSPWQGVNGLIRWDPLGHNTRKGDMRSVSCPKINSP